MDLETVWYETFPYLYGIAGIVSILIRPGSLLLKISGVLLVVAALTILRLRWVYRRNLFERAPTTSSIIGKAGLGDD